MGALTRLGLPRGPGRHPLPLLSGGLQCRGSVTEAPLVKAVPMWIPLEVSLRSS